MEKYVINEELCNFDYLYEYSLLNSNKRCIIKKKLIM